MHDRIREELSRYVDGDLHVEESAEIEQVLASSEEARAYLSQLRLLRRHLRYEPADSSPDVTGPVLAAIAEARRGGAVLGWRIAAAFAAGIVAGVTFIGFSLQRPGPVAMADIPDQVLAAQSEVTSLRARLHIVERGWHPDVAERRFAGSIAYRAPESLLIEIRDLTIYPSSRWVPNDTTQVIDEDVSWSQSVPSCPTQALPDCAPSELREQATTEREPFPEASAAPLDLIVPVRSFTRASEPGLVGFRELDGRQAVGVEVTAAQVIALLDGLISTGNWREVHPTDRVELWLDRDALIPLALSVFPAQTPERSLWAIRRGYGDVSGVPVLEVTWSEVSLNDGAPTDFPAPPGHVQAVSSGFRPGTPADLETVTPDRLPDSMIFYRSGTVSGSGPSVSVATWTDGRAWLKMRWTRDWQATRLFGDLGTLVRQIPLGAGVAYLNERGDRIALHGDDIDLVLLGSLPTGDLLEVAESLSVTGRTVPDQWAEAANGNPEDARDAVDGLLLPGEVEGFGTPSIRVQPGTAVLSYAGPGNRAFLLTEAVDDELSPPLEANVRGVRVRGIDGRYSPDRGVLEWVEGNLTISLASNSLSLDELVVIAEMLRNG